MDKLEKIRIDKYLASQGYCSRREADKLIQSGRVRINGRTALLGDKVGASDKVVLSGAGSLAKKLIYVGYNKPIRMVTHSATDEEEDVIDNLELEEKVYPIGRLDKASHGLIILTNDGRVTERLLSPERLHEKEYVVKTSKPLKDSFLRKMGAGVRIEDYVTKPAKVRQLGQNVFAITITEGKKHQIRRMCAALGLDVIDLQRVRIMNVKLSGLKPGRHRILKGDELAGFLEALRLPAVDKK